MSVEAMKQALKALEKSQPVNYCENSYGEKSYLMVDDPFKFERNDKAITALRQAIKQAEKQEPVAWLEYGDWGDLFVSRERKGSFPVYSAPPKREWVGLTDEDVGVFKRDYQSGEIGSFVALTSAIEAKLRERNT
jgi:hypothetical protein